MKALFPSDTDRTPLHDPQDLQKCLALLDIREDDVSTFPFTGKDVSSGVENELQVCVKGSSSSVDLPQIIQNSLYISNIYERVQRGDISSQTSKNLEFFLEENHEEIWENSWVRFPYELLSPFARETFEHDLLADKNNPTSGFRKDRDQFFIEKKNDFWVRVPISYLLKLALIDIISTFPSESEALRTTGLRLANHFLNDNSSPETLSFHIVRKTNKYSIGEGVARETAKRFLFTHLLLQYANTHFQLEKHGQSAMAFFSPHPPIRQRKLNRYISDSYYRQLFMSPCLSGWNRGEEKHRYMEICHEVLSRSQLNGVLKMREAGVILNNLVILPHTSNVSLANNGTHISLGSVKLSSAVGETTSAFTPGHEKYIGDLSSKIIEHFLPLFVSNYSAAPYRIDFQDFHPETLLGFLPHELDYTHLRMIWRRWKKRQSIGFSAIT